MNTRLATVVGATTTASRVAERGPTNAALTSQPFTVEGFALYESHIGKAGAHYEAIARYQLG